MNRVKFETSLGAITIDVDSKLCPITAKNFLDYCNSGFYNETIFHRVINNFVAQAGGMLEDMSPKQTNAPIQNEAHLGYNNDAGTIAMARTNDPHSATCQFFINLVGNDFLNFKEKNSAGWGYCAFAKVSEGMDVVKKIAAVQTGNQGYHQDVPEEAIKIINVTVEETVMDNA